MAASLSLEVWESDVNVSANTSVVTAVVRITTSGSSWNGYSPSGTVYIDGAAYGFSHGFGQNQTTELARFSRTIGHNSDGSRSVHVSVSFATGISAGTLTASRDITLTTIPRASSIDSVNWSSIENSFNVTFSALSSSFNYKLRVSIPNVKAIVTYSNYSSGTDKSFSQAEKNSIYQYMVDNNLSSVSLGFVIETHNGSTKIGESSEPTKTVTRAGSSSITTDRNVYNAGNTVVITIKRNSSTYSHKLRHKLNDVNLGTTTPGTSESYSGVSLSAFGQKYPNASSGTLVLELDTYYNTVWLGTTTKSVTFNLTNYALSSPTLGITLVNDNSVVKGWGIYLQNYSKYTATLTGAKGYYSSTIEKYLFNGNEQDESSYTSGIINSKGTVKITGQVKDSRGKVSAIVSKEIAVVEYSRPSVSNVVCQRYNGTAVHEEGTQLRVQANFSYASCSGKNSASCKAYIKENTASSYTELGVLVSGVAKIFTSVSLSINKVYNVKIVVTDAIGVQSEQIATVTTASAIIDILKGGTGVAIGKMAGTANLLDIAWNTNIEGNLVVQGVPTIGNKLERKGTNTIGSPAADTTSNWGKQGTSYHFYSNTGQINGQPSQWGYLLNVGDGSEVHQLWMTQASGDLYHRGGNGAGWSGSWKTLLDSSNYKEFMKNIYPVGAVYITYNNNNPGNFIGGTWVQFGQGRVLVGQGTGNDGSTSMSFTAGGTGGKYNKTLEPKNVGFYEVGMINHQNGNYWGVHGHNNFTSFNIQPPYIVVYFWRRTN